MYTFPIHEEKGPCSELNTVEGGKIELKEDWECRGAVPERIGPSYELPECEPSFLDLVEKYRDLFNNISSVAHVNEFMIQTIDSRPIKVPPRLIPQVYCEEAVSNQGNV